MVLHRHVKAVFPGLLSQKAGRHLMNHLHRSGVPRSPTLFRRGICARVFSTRQRPLKPLISLAQQRETPLVDLIVPDLARVLPEIHGFAFLQRQQSFLHQPVQIDEIGIPCKG